MKNYRLDEVSLASESDKAVEGENPQIISIGKDVHFTLKNGTNISGKILDADCAGKWCRVLIKSGYWKLIKGTNVKSMAVV